MKDFEIRQLQALDAASAQHAFDAFVRIYDQEFPAVYERADPQQWLNATGPEEPQVIVLIAGRDLDSASQMQVYGGAVFEYYPLSECALLAYIVVARDAQLRGRGIGRALLDQGVDALIELAGSLQREVRMLLAEAEDFRLPEVAARSDTFAADQRMAVHDRLGGLWLPIDYTAPRIAADQPRDTHLLLMVFPHPRITSNVLSVQCDTVAAFLREYFSAEEPREDDTRALLIEDMTAQLQALAREYHQQYLAASEGPFDPAQASKPIDLQSLPQPIEPVLELPEVAVCLHFIDPRQIEQTDIYCPIYHSFETDILSYRFQDSDKPVHSSCIDDAQTRAVIDFGSTTLSYVTEGRVHTKFGGARLRRELAVTAALTWSYFPNTRLRIWHLALQPAHGTVFNEYDVIRLLSFYYQQQEQSQGAVSRAVFRVDGEDMSLARFVSRLSLEHEDSGGQTFDRPLDTDLFARPVAGIVEFDPAAGLEPDMRQAWFDLTALLNRASMKEQTAYDELEQLYAAGDAQPLGRLQINALSGIVSATYDHVQMNFAEMMDTLVPDSSTGKYNIWFNRATLSNLSLIGTMLERCGRTIGISPYLVIPHAVLLHNEHIVNAAIDRGGGGAARRGQRGGAAG